MAAGDHRPYSRLELVQAADDGREQHDLHRIAVLADERMPARLGPAFGEPARGDR
jgi:hypothetical protein